MGSLDHLEPNTWLVVPIFDSESINNGVTSAGHDISCGGTRDSSEILRELSNISLEREEGLVALMVGVLRVELETENEALIDRPVGIWGNSSLPIEAVSALLNIINCILANSVKSGEQRSWHRGCGGCGGHLLSIYEAANNHQSCDDSSEVLHLFLSFPNLIL